MEKIFIHYGHSIFDPNQFVDISLNDESLCNGRKPRNGLWGTDIESYHGWKEVLLSDLAIMRNEKWRLEKSFIFTLNESTKLLAIKKEEDFINLLFPYFRNTEIDFSSIPIIKYQVDWKKVAEDYDAIEVYAGSNEILKAIFYGWECDSICVFHKKNILIIQ